MYSINRGTVAESSLNESLLNERSDTLLTQKIQRNTSKKDPLARSATTSSKVPLNDPSLKNTRFHEQTDLRTVLDNFLSQPTQFKYNKDHTKIFVISQTIEPPKDNSTQDKKITSKLEVYDLPEFKLKESSNLPDI